MSPDHTSLLLSEVHQIYTFQPVEVSNVHPLWKIQCGVTLWVWTFSLKRDSCEHFYLNVPQLPRRSGFKLKFKRYYISLQHLAWHSTHVLVLCSVDRGQGWRSVPVFSYPHDIEPPRCFRRLSQYTHHWWVNEWLVHWNWHQWNNLLIWVVMLCTICRLTNWTPWW